MKCQVIRDWEGVMASTKGDPKPKGLDLEELFLKHAKWGAQDKLFWSENVTLPVVVVTWEELKSEIPKRYATSHNRRVKELTPPPSCPQPSLDFVDLVNLEEDLVSFETNYVGKVDPKPTEKDALVLKSTGVEIERNISSDDLRYSFPLGPRICSPLFPQIEFTQLSTNEEYDIEMESIQKAVTSLKETEELLVNRLQSLEDRKITHLGTLAKDRDALRMFLKKATNKP